MSVGMQRMSQSAVSSQQSTPLTAHFTSLICCTDVLTDSCQSSVSQSATLGHSAQPTAGSRAVTQTMKAIDRFSYMPTMHHVSAIVIGPLLHVGDALCPDPVNHPAWCVNCEAGCYQLELPRQQTLMTSYKYNFLPTERSIT